MKYEKFYSWSDVLTFVGRNPHGCVAQEPLYYHAPMDYHPTRVDYAICGERVYVIAPGIGCDPFYADKGHLERFRKVSHG